MDDVLVIDRRLATYEFRWLSAVGLTCFLVSAALGSMVLMAAGLMMWGYFSMLARRILRQEPPQAGHVHPVVARRQVSESSPLGSQVSSTASTRTMR